MPIGAYPPWKKPFRCWKVKKRPTASIYTVVSPANNRLFLLMPPENQVDNGLSITNKDGRSGRLEQFPAVLADYAEKNNDGKMAL